MFVETAIALFFIGVCVGFAVGSLNAHKWQREAASQRSRRIRAQAFRAAEREHLGTPYIRDGVLPDSALTLLADLAEIKDNGHHSKHAQARVISLPRTNRAV